MSSPGFFARRLLLAGALFLLQGCQVAGGSLPACLAHPPEKVQIPEEIELSIENLAE
jgi:hypothetical protein